MDKIPADRKKMLEESFKKIDRDGSGQMSKSEYKKFLKSVGVKINTKELDRCFAEVDKDDTGEIDFEEFCKLALSMGVGGPAVKTEEEEPDTKKANVLRAKKKNKKSEEEEEYPIDEKAKELAEQIKKLRADPTSVVEQMKDFNAVEDDKLKLNGQLDAFCQECLEELGKAEDPVKQKGTGQKFGNLLIENSDKVEGPVKTYIYYGDYDSAEQLLQKIILQEDEVDKDIANHFVDPKYTALGIAYHKPEDEAKNAMTMFAFVPTYVAKEKQ